MIVGLASLPAGAQEQSGPGPFSLQVTAGPTAAGGGTVLSAAFGYSPRSWLDLLLNVERDYLPFRLDRFDGVVSATRGGEMKFVSAELRGVWPASRVSPFAVAGIGRGVSRPNVNDMFPDRVRNSLGVVYFGGGTRFRLRRSLSLLTDVRALLAIEGNDALQLIWPVRAGIEWRF
jgi:hypothetical protein